MFNQTIRFHGIQDTIQIPYSGILGIDFLHGNEVIIDFNDKNLHSKNYTMRFKQNGYSNKGKEINEIFSVEQLHQEHILPFIDVLNQKLTYIGQFLLDTGSEGNLIKISSLPHDCEININDTVYLNGISIELVPT